MGVVYHTHYLDHFEAARTEALRALGVAYRDLEDEGVFLPVVEATLRYRRPARYDDELAVEVRFPEPPATRVVTAYAIRRVEPDGTLAEPPLVTGRVTLCFVDGDTGRPTDPPDAVDAAFAQV